MKGKKLVVDVIKNRVLVKIEEQIETTESGLVAIKLDDADQTLGEIVGVGELVGENICIGKKIMFNRYSGTQLTIENEKYRVMESDDILLIITKI